MNYRILGRTGLKISEIGFGCWAIGGQSYGSVRDEDSLQALRTAFDQGVNFFDTADTYGSGHSEEILALALKEQSRDQFFVATKVGHDFYHGAIKKNFQPDFIRFACEQSLKRLGVNEIDLYQLHNPALEIVTQSDALATLEQLKKEGKIRFIGVSAHDEKVAQACLQDTRVEALQLLFNLVDQHMSFRVFPEAKSKNVGVIVREPLANGLLTDKYTENSTFAKNDHRHGWSKERLALELEKVKKIKSVLATKRLSLARAAMEYVLEFEAVSTVIPGIKTKEQLLENLMASEHPLLRSQESSLLRDLYQRDSLFRKTAD